MRKNSFLNSKSFLEGVFIILGQILGLYANRVCVVLRS